MLDLSEKPRCAAYLKKLNARIDDPAMNEYWAALAIAESFSENRLRGAGINFNTQKGPEILSKIEDLLGRTPRRKRRSK